MALFLLSGVPTYSQSFSERIGIDSLFGISPSTDDFVIQVVLGELFEEELNKLAEQKGDDKTKAFAAEILKDHRQTSIQIRTLVKGGAVKAPYPTALDGVRRAELERLQTLTGLEFNNQFENIQTKIHEQAMSLFERYGNDGNHPDLKLFAHKHLTHLREHWRLVKSLKR